jgi:polyketide synthase PksJ
MKEEIKIENIGTLASTLDLSKIELKNIPDRIKDEIPTLNQFGYMKEELDEYSEEFILNSKNAKNPVMEIGTAYGYVSLKVLEQGARLIANDISQEHLDHLVSKTTKDKLKNLSIINAAFPGDVDLPKNSLDSLLISRVIHFFDGITIERALDKIHDWLIEGGSLYLTSCSIYHYAVKHSMPEKYNALRSDDIYWPGIIENQKTMAKDHAPFVRDLFHVFDIPQLEELLPKHGFKIERISLFDYPDDTDSGGKGHVGFKATKI